jgi:phosphoesterase RecJ-like protein
LRNPFYQEGEEKDMEQDNKYYMALHNEFKAIYKEIRKYDRIVIFRHEIPDFDALGTQMGLVHWIRAAFPQKEVHFLGEGMHSFIPRIFPEPETLPDSWYDLPYLAIIVDTSNMERVSLPKLDKAACVIKFDHHPLVEKFGTLVSVHPEMSSCSELVSLFIETMGGSRHGMTKEAARDFYIGMVGDSGRFRFPETSPMTLRLAADLLQTGIDKEQIYSQMYYESLDEFNFKKWVLTHYTISKGGTAYYILKDEDLKAMHLAVGDGKIHLDLFRDVEGISSCCSITEDKVKGLYHLSFRSETKPIAKVAVMYQGGGHDFAAGGKLKDLKDLPGLIQALDDLKPVR